MGKKYDLLVPEVNALFKQYQTKMTLRQIYYRLVAKLLIPNTLNQYKALSRILVKAREKGDVDYRMIEDRARTTIGGRDLGWDDEDEFLEDMKKYIKTLWEQFSMSVWEPQDNYVEVWVEKEALSALLSQVCSEFAETVLMTCIGNDVSPRLRTCPSRGYSSYTYIMDAVNRLFNYVDKKIIILYLGDFDPSGLDITRDLNERLQRYGIKAIDVTVERLALNIDQIRKYQLPPMPAKRSDPRLASFIADTGGTDAVELDALEPPILQEIVRKGIQAKIDEDLWQDRLDDIEVIKEKLKETFGKMEIDWGERR